MMRFTQKLLAAGAFALVALPALAQPAPVPAGAPAVNPGSTANAPPGQVQGRFNDQQQRIDQGLASGQLTGREAARDESHLRYDERERNRDLRANGGHLTPAEKVQLNRQLNHNSRRIYNTKHNGVTQPGVPPK